MLYYLRLMNWRVVLLFIFLLLVFIPVGVNAKYDVIEEKTIDKSNSSSCDSPLCQTSSSVSWKTDFEFNRDATVKVILDYSASADGMDSLYSRYVEENHKTVEKTFKDWGSGVSTSGTETIEVNVNKGEKLTIKLFAKATASGRKDANAKTSVSLNKITIKAWQYKPPDLSEDIYNDMRKKIPDKYQPLHRYFSSDRDKFTRNEFSEGGNSIKERDIYNQSKNWSNRSDTIFYKVQDWSFKTPPEPVTIWNNLNNDDLSSPEGKTRYPMSLVNQSSLKRGTKNDSHGHANLGQIYEAYVKIHSVTPSTKLYYSAKNAGNGEDYVYNLIKNNSTVNIVSDWNIDYTSSTMWGGGCSPENKLDTNLEEEKVNRTVIKGNNLKLSNKSGEDSSYSFKDLNIESVVTDKPQPLEQEVNLKVEQEVKAKFHHEEYSRNCHTESCGNDCTECECDSWELDREWDSQAIVNVSDEKNYTYPGKPQFQAKKAFLPNGTTDWHFIMRKQGEGSYDSWNRIEFNNKTVVLNKYRFFSARNMNWDPWMDIHNGSKSRVKEPNVRPLKSYAFPADPLSSYYKFDGNRLLYTPNKTFLYDAWFNSTHPSKNEKNPPTVRLSRSNYKPPHIKDMCSSGSTLWEKATSFLRNDSCTWLIDVTGNGSIPSEDYYRNNQKFPFEFRINTKTNNSSEKYMYSLVENQKKEIKIKDDKNKTSLNETRILIDKLRETQDSLIVNATVIDQGSGTPIDMTERQNSKLVISSPDMQDNITVQLKKSEKIELPRPNQKPTVYTFKFKPEDWLHDKYLTEEKQAYIGTQKQIDSRFLSENYLVKTILKEIGMFVVALFIVYKLADTYGILDFLDNL